MLIEFEGDVFRVDEIVALVVYTSSDDADDEVGIYIRGREKGIMYPFDDEADARKAQIEFTARWKKAVGEVYQPAAS